MRIITVVATASALLCILAGCNTLSEALLVARKLSEPPEAGINGAPFASRNALAPTRNDGDAINPDDVEAALRAMEGKSTDGGVVCPLPGKAPPDQEISVNLVYAGLTPAARGKNLDFDFKAFWGTYKSSVKTVSMPASAKRGEAQLDLGVAKLKVVPKIVSDMRGHYNVTLTDQSGSLIGGFNIADSGKQVSLSAQPTKYDARLVYYHAENRLTGWEISRKGSATPELGLIFVGNGWSYVENAKRPDMSKGYLFPEVDMVVLPKAWMEDNEMKDSCNTLKRGTENVGGVGGVCYS